MNSIVEQAQVAVKLDGRDANEAIKELTGNVDKYTNALIEAYKAGDKDAMKQATKDLKDAERQLSTFQKQAFEVNKVLNDLNNASPKDLKRAIKELNAEMESGAIKRGSKEWDDSVKNISRLRNELDKTKQSVSGVGEKMREAKIQQDSWLSSIKQSLTSNIACLLGEHMVETEMLLSSIAHDFDDKDKAE